MSSAPDYYLGYRKEMKPLLPESYTRVLEIGCGEGNFRQNLKHKHEYWGVEPAESAASKAKDKLDKVLVGIYESVVDQIPDNYFDLVICNDVIEHMVDHEAFLRSIKSKMTTNGCLVASIPNVRFIENLAELLFQRDWRYREAGILDRTHLRFFTERSVVRSVLENGFVIDKKIGINRYKGYRAYFGLMRIPYFLALLILGRDIRYLQFGICIRVAR